MSFWSTTVFALISLISPSINAQLGEWWGPFYYPSNNSTTDPVHLSLGVHNATHLFLNIIITGNHWFGFGFAKSALIQGNMKGTDAIIFGYFDGKLNAMEYTLGNHTLGIPDTIQGLTTVPYDSGSLVSINIKRRFDPSTAGDYDDYIIRYPFSGELCWIWAVGTDKYVNSSSSHGFNKGYYCLDIGGTNYPTPHPSTAEPTVSPTLPTKTPSKAPTDITKNPTKYPTKAPTSLNPTSDPTVDPTIDPTIDPTFDPTLDPTDDPTINPTASPTYYRNWKEFKGITCNDLSESYDEMDGVTTFECFTRCWNDTQCIGSVWYPYYKNVMVSRCYLYNGYCFGRHESEIPVIAAFWDHTSYDNFTLQCVDYPIDWMDQYNDQCSDHREGGWCTNLFNTSSTILNDADTTYKLNAIQVCCDCNGGLYTYSDGLLLESIWKPSHILSINDMITCNTYNNVSSYNDIIHEEYQWNLSGLLNICNFFHNELYQQYRIIYSLSNNMNEDLLSADFMALKQLNCFEALYLFEVIICDNSNNDYWAFIINIDVNKMYINSNYINITDFPSWYHYKHDFCNMSSILDSIHNADNLMVILLCDIIASKPYLTTSTTTAVTEQCDDYNVAYFKRFSFQISTTMDNNDEFMNKMKLICSNAFRKTIIMIHSVFESLWCFIQIYFKSSSVTTRRLLQNDNNYKIDVEFSFNYPLQRSFFNDYNETEFLIIFLQQIASDAVSYGIVDNEGDITNLVLITITTPSPTISATGKDDKSGNDEVLIMIIIFGAGGCILILIILMLMIWRKLRNIEKREEQHIQLTAFSARASPPSYGEGNKHETYDTIDIANEIAKDIKENRDEDLL